MINPAEFAGLIDGTPHTLNGVSVPCIVDDDTAEDHTAEGVFIDEFLLYVETRHLSPIPVPTQRLVIDGRKASVIHVDDTDGQLVIRLKWFDS